MRSPFIPDIGSVVCPRQTGSLKRAGKTDHQLLLFLPGEHLWVNIHIKLQLKVCQEQTSMVRHGAPLAFPLLTRDFCPRAQSPISLGSPQEHPAEWASAGRADVLESIRISSYIYMCSCYLYIYIYIHIIMIYHIMLYMFVHDITRYCNISLLYQY